jgi:PAS domain S-box-containing protein
MTDAASFDAIMQCNLLEVFCEALGAALFVTDKRDEVSFASVRLQHLFPVPTEAIQPGKRARDLYSALFDAGCRLGIPERQKSSVNRDEWIAERVAIAWRERTDTIEQCGPGRWLRTVSRRFPSGLGLTILIDVSEHKKKENLWRVEQERIRLTEEILDRLPIAIAVKDRNLNFAAVNQKYCAMLGMSAEALIGHNIEHLFEPGFAASLREQDRELLESGIEQQSLVVVNSPDGTSRSILHRSRRIGRADAPYLVMSFEDVPTGEQGAVGTSSAPDTIVRVGPAGTPVQGETRIVKANELRRIIYVCPFEAEPDIRHASDDGIEFCTVASVAELAALLPALRDAGLPIDLIVIAEGAGREYAVLAKRHGIKHITSAYAAGALMGVSSRIVAIPDPKHPHPQTSAPAGKPFSDPSRVEILVVEDNPINQMAVEQIFGSLGLEFVVASTGAEGLTRITELRPSLVFADVTLPDMRFDVFAKAVHQTAAQGSAYRPAIIALLVNGVSQDANQLGAEVVDTLMKPLSPDAIDQMIRKHLFESRNLTATSAKSAA